jgi:hypothetical protein
MFFAMKFQVCHLRFDKTFFIGSPHPHFQALMRIGLGFSAGSYQNVRAL